MPSRTSSTDSLTQALRDKQVAHASAERKQRICIHFCDGTTLVVEARSEELMVKVNRPHSAAVQDHAVHPTKRQLEYLSFIAKYSARFGRPPAESDIQRHLLVSAPSVNQMMQMLQRRGFIARQQGVPRSIRICIPLP
jgi:LexA DNA binding domain